MFSRILVIVELCFVSLGQSSVFDEELYELVLDPAACDEQLALLSNNTFGLLRCKISGFISTDEETMIPGPKL